VVDFLDDDDDNDGIPDDEEQAPPAEEPTEEAEAPEEELPQDKCIEDCACPEGMTGVEPFCHPIEPEEVEEVLLTPEPPGAEAEVREEVEEDIIVPEINTITGNAVDDDDDDDEEADNEPAGPDDADDADGPNTGASTGGVERLQAQGLYLAAVASFLTLLL